MVCALANMATAARIVSVFGMLSYGVSEMPTRRLNLGQTLSLLWC